jgi:hypothetical protein
VVYGGTVDEIFSMELAAGRSVVDTARWYRQSLGRLGWREVVLHGPGRDGVMRLSAKRGASWLHGRVRRDPGGETEIAFAVGQGVAPRAEAVLPEETAPASGPTSQNVEPDGGLAPAISGDDVREALHAIPLPSAIRLVGEPAVHGGHASVVVQVRGAVESLLPQVETLWTAAGWRCLPPSTGPVPRSRLLRATRGNLVLTLTLIPISAGTSGTLDLGSSRGPATSQPR